MWGFMRGYMWGNGHFATREGHYHPIGGDLNDRLRNAVLQTGVVNSADAAADLLDQLHTVEQIEEQRVPRDAPAAQVLLSHSGGKSARRHALHPVLEDVNLHVGGAAIVTVSDGVDHGLSQCALGQLQPLVSSLRVGNEG